MQFRAIADSRAGDIEHGGAHIEGNHGRALLDEPLSERPAPAADLQYPLAGDLTEQRHRRRAFVVAVGSAARVVAVVLDRHGVIFRRGQRRVPFGHRPARYQAASDTPVT